MSQGLWSPTDSTNRKERRIVRRDAISQIDTPGQPRKLHNKFNHFQNPGAIVLTHFDYEDYKRKDCNGAAIGKDYMNPVDLRKTLRLQAGGFKLTDSYHEQIRNEKGRSEKT